jgi:hypothetical protein
VPETPTCNWSPKECKRNNRAEAVFEKITAENYTDPMKVINPQIQNSSAKQEPETYV